MVTASLRASGLTAATLGGRATAHMSGGDAAFIFRETHAF
jgi:hypothetical protein